MRILIKSKSAPVLDDSDNFKEFHVDIIDSEVKYMDVAAALGPRAEMVDEGVFWISADYVRTLAARDSDPEWQRRFMGMLEAVRPYGWSNDDLTRIRVHAKRR